MWSHARRTHAHFIDDGMAFVSSYALSAHCKGEVEDTKSVKTMATRVSHCNSVEMEATLSLMRRGLVQALESLDVDLFQRKLETLLEDDYAEMVLQSGLGLEGKTALHLAVECGFEEALKLLLATEKVNLLAISGDTGWTALHTAVSQEDPVAIRILLRYPIETLDAGGNSGESATHSCEDRLLRARELLWCHSTNPIGVTALHMAVQRNNAECVRTLLEDANWLHSRLAEFRPNEYGVSELEGSAEICCIQDRNGDTALHWAVATRNHETAHLLCSFGAQIHKPINHKGHEPLTICKDVLGDKKMTAILTPFKRLDQPVVDSPELTHQPPSLVMADSASAYHQPAEPSCRLRRPGVPSGTFRRLPTDEAVETGERRRSTDLQVSFGEICRTRPYLSRSAKDSDQAAGDDVFADDYPSPSSNYFSPEVFEGDAITESDYYALRRQASVKPCQKLQQPPCMPALLPEKLECVASRLARVSALSLCRKRPSVCLNIPGTTCPAPLLVPEQIPLQPLPPKPIPLRARRRASCMDPNEYYPMASPRRGICLIMNSMTYWHPKFQDRGGCDKDESRVEKVFRDLGFLVKLLRNLSSGEMKAQLKHLGSATDHSTYDCFVTVIMAHGGAGEIYGVDGSPFPLHELTSFFTADKCPTLAGKPKLFFIQACRGEEYQLGYAPPSSRSSVTDTLQLVPKRAAAAAAIPSPPLNPFEARSSYATAPPPCGRQEATTPDNTEDEEPAVVRDEEPAVLAAKLPRCQRLVPTFADFLISCATKAGFKAQRDPKEGSIYIQSLCRHLEQYARVRSLLDIITGVHREVSEKVFVAASASKNSSGPIFQQTPEVRHTLTRRVQFV